MNRRNFIQISSVSLAALLVEGCNIDHELDIEYMNDMSIGHLAFESHQFPMTKKLSSKYLIVGGGIAGMSAAYALRNEDFLLFELSDLLGGSSAGSNYGKISLCHGAHYDLSYPADYGQEVLNMLAELGIVYHDAFSNSWKFSDKKYLIPKNKKSRIFDHGIFRNDVLPDGSEKLAFIELMKKYSGSMPMPTRLIDAKFHGFNEVSFLNWLQRRIEVSVEFATGLDYHLKDDYGAGAAEVSALAGIHYFACRPYYTKPVELFSPPEGNYYFIKKIYASLPKERIHTSHLVKSIVEKNHGFEVEIIDATKKEITQLTCDKVIYAGHKHALKYIYPPDYPIFEKTTYAPWVVVNVVFDKSMENEAFWQNEIISDDKALLGFVDSEAQATAQNEKRVFTVYFCFKPDERKWMSKIEERKQTFVDKTICYLEQYFDQSLKNRIEKVFVKQMGHAMPIPAPGYLLKDGNSKRSNPNLVYAGVDNGRLPLLFEALDSGISAVSLLRDGSRES